MKVYQVSEYGGPFRRLTELSPSELVEWHRAYVAGEVNLIEGGSLLNRAEQARIILFAREMGWL